MLTEKLEKFHNFCLRMGAISVSSDKFIKFLMGLFVDFVVVVRGAAMAYAFWKIYKSDFGIGMHCPVS